MAKKTISRSSKKRFNSKFLAVAMLAIVAVVAVFSLGAPQLIGYVAYHIGATKFSVSPAYTALYPNSTFRSSNVQDVQNANLDHLDSFAVLKASNASLACPSFLANGIGPFIASGFPFKQCSFRHSTGARVNFTSWLATGTTYVAVENGAQVAHPSGIASIIITHSSPAFRSIERDGDASIHVFAQVACNPAGASAWRYVGTVHPSPTSVDSVVSIGNDNGNCPSGKWQVDSIILARPITAYFTTRIQRIRLSTTAPPTTAGSSSVSPPSSSSTSPSSQVYLYPVARNILGSSVDDPQNVGSDDSDSAAILDAPTPSLFCPSSSGTGGGVIQGPFNDPSPRHCVFNSNSARVNFTSWFTLGGTYKTRTSALEYAEPRRITTIELNYSAINSGCGEAQYAVGDRRCFVQVFHVFARVKCDPGGSYAWHDVGICSSPSFSAVCALSFGNDNGNCPGAKWQVSDVIVARPPGVFFSRISWIRLKQVNN